MIRRRFAWLCLAAAIVLAQVTEEVLGNESTVVDRQVLIAIHDGVAPNLHGMFGVATLTASGRVLWPAVMLGAIALGLARRRHEALLLAVSAAIASLVVYCAKTAFGRARPDLWDTQWYWGSSFPSGHTLSAAAIATAVFLIVARLRPAWRPAAAVAAIGWVVLVALSRLVLGVHWPTDVVAAACAGLLVTAGVNVVLLTIEHRKKA